MNRLDPALSKVLGELISVAIGVWGIRVLLSKQHRLHGLALVIRWAVVLCGFTLFYLWQRELLPPLVGLLGLLFCCFFLLLPDISFYLALGWQKLTSRGSSA